MRIPSLSSRPHPLARLRPDPGLPARIRRAAFALRSLKRDRLTPSEEWIEDNAGFLLREAAARIREAKSYPPLPARAGVPRVLLLARQVCQKDAEEIDEGLVLRTAKENPDGAEYRWDETGALGCALAIALLEGLDDALEKCLSAPALTRRAEKWAEDFAAERRADLPEEDGLLFRVLDCLSDRENPDALLRADEALSSRGGAEEILRLSREKRSLEGRQTGRTVRFLRALPHLPVHRIAQRLCPAARILREEATFRRMDDDGRDLYLLSVRRIADKCRVPDSETAAASLRLARAHEGMEGEAGFYLLRRPDLLMTELGRKRRYISDKHRQRLFLAPLYLGAGLSGLLLTVAGVPLWAVPAGVLCASELIRLIYFRLLRHFFPARPLPRLKMEHLTEETRTLVAVPVLLTSRRQALRSAHHLAVLRCADPEADYLLLSDFADGPREEEPEDAGILAALREAVSALNQRWGGGFFCLHRARQWDERQQCFTARERKRGALESLNRLLCGESSEDAFAYASCPLKSLSGRYAYVVTLDADTFLPPGAVKQLAGAMEHPLQKGRVAVIQPRMEVAPDRVKTRTQKLLGGRGGADPYHLSVQDVYQDVLDAGSFVGKGIFAPRLWLDRLEGRLPAGRLLSHDLIEGEIAVCALSEDIALFDGHPARLAGWQKRLHRWTRGDWQLLPFLWDRRLSLLSRHKVWDNLRRSMVPAARLFLLLLGTARFPLLILLALPWPLKGMSARLLPLPGKALCCLDGAARALYRQFISRRHLLSWVTADQSEDSRLPALSALFPQALTGTAMILLSLLPGGILPGAALGIAWAAAGLLIPYLDGPADRPKPMAAPQTREARALARETWAFFADSVNETTHFLPPDNVQIDPARGAAMRTSPTNVGLYLLSCCAAREMGLVTTKEMARRLSDSLDSLEKMEKWQGHLYNWYDLHDLSPLSPAFVSSVDSGNLCACLLCCAQICRSRLGEMEEQFLGLPARLDALARRMDLAALYDRKAELFYVGWNTETGKPTSAHYDLMASEARLLSFLAVSRGVCPLRHWRRLSRAAVRAGGGAALLSWGGTMFEYLLPALLLPLIPGTLLGEGCLCAVRAQIFGAEGRPFGVSESGYYAFDPDMNYQYRAFGLPELSLSPETAGKVVAPYASVLALPFFPRAAGENIARMRRLHWADGHGFFEAADYTPGRVEGAPHIVKSHMAHHQGMILCALCNALTGNALVRAFMTMPEHRAYAYLLWERPPRRVPRELPLPPARREENGVGPLRHAARTGLPLDAQALSGKNTSWVIAANGQGFLKAGDCLITRFDPEAGAQTGPQFYLRDAQNGAVHRLNAGAQAYFDLGCAHFEKEAAGIRTFLTCCVDPLTGMAAAALRLENPDAMPREIEIASFLEIAQGPWRDDIAHPTFRDLSVRVLPWGTKGLCARRLPRDEKEKRLPLICHAAAGDFSPVSCQGDRQLFLGPRGSYADPEQLHKSLDECALRTGDVLSPCLSLRCAVHLPAGGEKTVYFLTLALPEGEEPEEALFTPARARTAFSLAAVQARMTLRALKIDGRALGLYQQMLGAALFSGQPHQFGSLPSGRDALWRLGVSGDLPVILLRLAPRPDLPLIRHALRAHGWMRMQGIAMDLILFCPPEGDYRRPCRDAAEALLSASSERGKRGLPGGVHIVSGGDGEAGAAESLCRLVLRCGLSLRSQLTELRRPLPPACSLRLALPLPENAPLLASFNSFGGFSREGAYWVLSTPPMPWHNVLCGERFGTLTCDRGILGSWRDNSRLDRVTRWCPDPFLAPSGEEFYLISGDGTAWMLTAGSCVHAPGVTEYRGKTDNAEAVLSVFCHPRKPLGVRTLTVRSETGGAYRLCWLTRFSPGDGGIPVSCRPAGDWAFAHSESGVCWAAMEGAHAESCAPAALRPEGETLPRVLTHPLGPGSAALLTLDITLPPRLSRRITMALGCADSEQAARADYAALLSEGAADTERTVRALWSRRLSALQLYSGSDKLDRMMNLFLPYQVRAARLTARTGPYQPGGAVGFRDQLQDLLALLFTEPETARSHILLCAAHQFKEGDVQHWWHAPARGVRTRISDDKLFLPFLTARYVSVTGDDGILTEIIPYLDAAPLAENEEDRYENPPPAADTETLLLHCIRAVDSVGLGAHGLPLMGGGDWNDAMNRLGGRRGESVWLGFFLCLVLEEFAPLCPDDVRQRFLDLRRRLLSAADAAWTGEWYLRAWRDDGRPVAGPNTDPPRIDLITQCFAVLAGAPRNKARDALRRAADQLYHRKHGIVKLMDPPFTPEEAAGYIGAYLPGVRENGGQYTHAAAWLILALCKIGDHALAWEVLSAILPENHTDTREKALTYRAEPYVLAGDVYAGENPGRAGWTWYTGSAAWLYWAVLTGLLGFEKRGDRARLRPCPVPEGEEYTITYRFGSTLYHFTAAHDAVFPTLDGLRLEDGWAPLLSDGRTHEARYPLPRA